MKLTLYEFSALPFELKESFVIDNGKFLINQYDRIHTYSLYSYSDYYIELIYYRKSLIIKDVTPFYRGARLDKYLDTIELNGL